MSRNVTSPERSVAKELLNGSPEPDVVPSSPVMGDEEDENTDDDRQALLSPSSRAVGGDESEFRPAGSQQRVKEFSHVSNWLYVKGILVETMPTLMFALLGTFLTGELLELLANWQAFKAIDELLILVPMLLNLKGNLEMNLSARLSTAANMGDLDNRRTRRQLILGNLTLLQVQGILVSCVAAMLSFLIGLVLPSPETSSDIPSSDFGGSEDALTASAKVAYTLIRLIPRGRPPHHPPSTRPSPAASGPREFLIMLVIGQTAASGSSLILGAFMCCLVLLCRYFKLNPDNIAPAVASALGDLLTLSLFGLSSHFLYPLSTAGLIAVQLGYITIFIGSFYLTLKNPRIKGLLREGWTPLLSAMVISSGTGMILDTFVTRYRDYAMVSIAQDGIPGSVGSVYISRLSTALHEAEGHNDHQRGDGHDHHTMPTGSLSSPPKGLFGPKDGATERAIKESRPRVSGMALFSSTVPVVILFVVVSYATKWVDLPALWAVGFIIFFELAVVAGLCLSHYLALFLWNRDYDPDTYALPIQSALCDLIGQSLLVSCYELAGLIGGKKVLQS
ncbi:hypothetical protein M408DRAFT_200605 [Serendipita vermifera MAFF 305830]|uniref:SLC41A/MgtE integral membrane domain-containing protein n=2 Tax=Serendipita vermifera MAFF 305830 TaxID=933852 RepID=A0A0C2XAA7_SERVB|nr:hypothetical protein M408DRAFT_200605 [Serendipita vermifera MAFF 305830]